MSIDQLVLATQSNGEAALANLLEQMADELKATGSVDLPGWQARYPQLASEIERLAPTLEALVEFSSAGGTPMAIDAEESFTEKTLGDFRIVRELGRGGMGIVYEAEQLSLNRRVALKILPTAAVLDPRTLQRFKNEAQAAAALDHPHIVDVYGIGCERAVHYYAMRLIDGCTLADLIADIGEGEAASAPSSNPKSQIPNRISTAPLALLSTVRSANKSAFYRKVAELGIHVASGLDHAHQQGVIHRDIKPSNLMLDGQGKVWITDFGLAHIEANQSLTVSGDLLGTLRYMSPEQALANRAPVDHRTDIYSLGATLYELLTLRAVFDDSDRAVLVSKIALSEPTPPRRHNPGIPADLETIVLKMLEKDPSSRYASAADLAADLARFVENKPITARRPSWRQRLAKWSSRNRSLVIAIAATVLVVAALVGGILGWWSRAAAAHRLVAERIAEEAWKSAQTFRQQRKWPEALMELKRAETALVGQHGSSELTSRIQASWKNAETVMKLEAIRLNSSATFQGDFDHSATHAAYESAFSELGIPALTLESEQIAAAVRQSPICEELAAALTFWAINRFHESDPNRLKFIQAARQADPDPWRNRLRQRWRREELVEILSHAPLDTLPASTLYLFIEACLWQQVNGERTQEKLQRVQRLHADDFWINYALAEFFSITDPPQFDESVRYYSVAIGLRPMAAAVHNNLGAVLLKQGRKAEAVAEFRRAIELEPDFSMARQNLDDATTSPSF